MSNFNIDLSITNLKNKVEGVSTFTFKDLGTENIKLEYKRHGHEQIPYINDINTANVDKNAIRASIRNIFNFIPGQQILEPEFGLPIYQYFYEPMNSILKQKIEAQITKCLKKYQPRISIKHVNIIQLNQYETYKIEINYIIPKLGIQSSEILQLALP